MWSVTYEDDLLADNYDYLNSITQFFTSTTSTDLAKFKTDAVYSGGMNPWDSCESSLYPLEIAFVTLMKLGLILSVLI